MKLLYNKKERTKCKTKITKKNNTIKWTKYKIQNVSRNLTSMYVERRRNSSGLDSSDVTLLLLLLLLLMMMMMMMLVDIRRNHHRDVVHGWCGVRWWNQWWSWSEGCRCAACPTRLAYCPRHRRYNTSSTVVSYTIVTLTYYSAVHIGRVTDLARPSACLSVCHVHGLVTRRPEGAEKPTLVSTFPSETVISVPIQGQRSRSPDIRKLRNSRRWYLVQWRCISCIDTACAVAV